MSTPDAHTTSDTERASQPEARNIPVNNPRERPTLLPPVAWREVIRDTIEGKGIGGGLTALFRADQEGFEALMASNADPVVNADTAEVVRRVDRTFGVGQSPSVN